jgi:hypothetical protein
MGHWKASASHLEVTGCVDLPSGYRILPPSATNNKGEKIMNATEAVSTGMQTKKMQPTTVDTTLENPPPDRSAARVMQLIATP